MNTPLSVGIVGYGYASKTFHAPLIASVPDWSWYGQLANPKARMEAITSRPLLLAALGKMTQHSGQTRVLLTVTHAAAAQVKALVANVRAGLQHVLATAPQLPSAQRWKALVGYIVEKILAVSTGNPKKTTSPPALAAG